MILTSRSIVNHELGLTTCWIIIILTFYFYLGLVLSGLIIIGNVFAAERIEPNIHRTVIDDLNFIKIKLGMIPQVIFDNLRKIIVMNLKLCFHKALIAVIFHGIYIIQVMLFRSFDFHKVYFLINQMRVNRSVPTVLP